MRKIISLNNDWLFVKDSKEVVSKEVGEKVNLPPKFWVFQGRYFILWLVSAVWPFRAVGSE